MDLAQDKIDLIERIIKSDRKFANNEDLYDDFFNETCKRSLLIIKTVTSDSTLEAYLRKIATTSILNVLKNEGRLRRTRSGFVPVKTVSTDDTNSDISDSMLNYSNVKVEYEAADIQDTPEDTAIKKDILQKIVDTIYEIDRKIPEKQYFKLYNLRFKDGLTQKEIAKELNLSQSEVSKRLFKLMNEVKQMFR